MFNFEQLRHNIGILLIFLENPHTVSTITERNEKKRINNTIHVKDELIMNQMNGSESKSMEQHLGQVIS